MVVQLFAKRNTLGRERDQRAHWTTSSPMPSGQMLSFRWAMTLRRTLSTLSYIARNNRTSEGGLRRSAYSTFQPQKVWVSTIFRKHSTYSALLYLMCSFGYACSANPFLYRIRTDHKQAGTMSLLANWSQQCSAVAGSVVSRPILPLQQPRSSRLRKRRMLLPMSPISRMLPTPTVFLSLLMIIFTWSITNSSSLELSPPPPPGAHGRERALSRAIDVTSETSATNKNRVGSDSRTFFARK